MSPSTGSRQGLLRGDGAVSEGDSPGRGLATGQAGNVLHVDFVSLSPAATAGARNALIDQAAALAALEGVLQLGVIEAEPGSDFDLVFFFLLPDFTALEPFGTDQRYVRFLQGMVAPNLKAFAGADVRLEADFPEPADQASCLALAAPAETYDWEVRERLNGWAAGRQGRAAIGLAVGERQRYRGLALVFTNEPGLRRPEFDANATFVAGRARRLG